jgi:hypothetical protein
MSSWVSPIAVLLAPAAAHSHGADSVKGIPPASSQSPPQLTLQGHHYSDGGQGGERGHSHVGPHLNPPPSELPFDVPCNLSAHTGQSLHGCPIARFWLHGTLVVVGPDANVRTRWRTE